MTSHHDFFTPRAQFHRVLATDGRAARGDLGYGIFYALIGFYLHKPGEAGSAYALLAPFLLAAYAAGHTAWQLWRLERLPRVRPFYDNLPRDRASLFYARLALLGAFCLGLDLIVALGIALRLNTAGSGGHYLFNPALFLLPFLAAAAATWANLGPFTLTALMMIPLAIYVPIIAVMNGSPLITLPLMIMIPAVLLRQIRRHGLGPEIKEGDA